MEAQFAFQLSLHRAAAISDRNRRRAFASVGMAQLSPDLAAIIVFLMVHPELLSRLCRARDLLRDWEGEPLTVVEVARRSGHTRSHFIRLFKAIFGEAPHQYRSRAQVEKAKHLLILTGLSITDVCMAVGFSSLGSFSALFSRRVGMPPSEFQRRHRGVSAPEPQLPASLIPGCLSLMAGVSEEEHFSRRQTVNEAGTVSL